MNWRVLRDQPYGVVIKPLIRGRVDAVRQRSPAKRLTPMGLVANESAKCFADFIDEIGYFSMYLGRRCGCFWARLHEYHMILGGQSVVPHSKFIRSGGRVKHIKASP